MLNDPEVNLVVVNTPDRFHVSYAKQILNAGKNALVKKPFAITADEAGALYGLAVHPIDQIVSLLGIPERIVRDVRSIFYPGEADDYYDFDFFYGNMKAVVKTCLSIMIDYPRFTLHGTFAGRDMGASQIYRRKRRET